MIQEQSSEGNAASPTVCDRNGSMSAQGGGQPGQGMLTGFRFPATTQPCVFGEAKNGSQAHLAAGSPYGYAGLPNQFYTHLSHPPHLPVSMTTNEGRYAWPPSGLPPHPFPANNNLGGVPASGSRSVGCEPFGGQYPRSYDPYPPASRPAYNFTPTGMPSGLISPTGHPLATPGSARFPGPLPPPPGRLGKKRTHSQSPLADLMDVHALTRHSQGSLNMNPTSLNRCRSTGSSGSYGHLSAGSLGALSPGTPGARRPASLGGSPYYPPPFLQMHHPPPPHLFAPRLDPCVPTSTPTGAPKRSSSGNKTTDDEFRGHCRTETAAADSQGRIPKEGDPDFVETDCRWQGCSKSFDHQDMLVKHINSEHIGTGKKNFTCLWRECSRERKPFKAQYMLVVHMRRHTGEKPHRCTFEGCYKAYSRLENLKTHLRSHTGEKPYPCEHPGCPKAFSNASDRAKHQNRTHSNEKPYVCKVEHCNKRYTDPSSLRKHVKTVHGPEVYANKKHKGESWSNKHHNGGPHPHHNNNNGPGIAGGVINLPHVAMQSPGSVTSTQTSPPLTLAGSHGSPGQPGSHGPVPMQQDALMKNEPNSEDEGVLISAAGVDGPAAVVRYINRTRSHPLSQKMTLNLPVGSVEHSYEAGPMVDVVDTTLKQTGETLLPLQPKQEMLLHQPRDSISTTSSLVSSGLGSLTSGSESYFRSDASNASLSQSQTIRAVQNIPNGHVSMAQAMPVQASQPVSTNNQYSNYPQSTDMRCPRCFQAPCVCSRNWGYSEQQPHMGNQQQHLTGYHSNQSMTAPSTATYQPYHQDSVPQPQQAPPQQQFYPAACTQSFGSMNSWPQSGADSQASQAQSQYLWNSGYNQPNQSYHSYQHCAPVSNNQVGPFSGQMAAQDSFTWPTNMTPSDNRDAGYNPNGSGILDDSNIPSVSTENLSYRAGGIPAPPADTSNMVVNDMYLTFPG